MMQGVLDAKNTQGYDVVFDVSAGLWKMEVDDAKNPQVNSLLFHILRDKVF